MNHNKFNPIRTQNVLVFLLLTITLIPSAHAAFKNTSVTLLTNQSYADVWMGLSTGGYRLLTERGLDYEFRVFIKNGMNDRSIHNLQVSSQSFPFNIKKITPEKIEQLRPMEIKIVYVVVEIPEGSDIGTYPFEFDFSSNEFPTGVFKLAGEIKVVKKLPKYLYPIYTTIILGLVVLLLYRKRRIWRLNARKGDIED